MSRQIQGVTVTWIGEYSSLKLKRRRLFWKEYIQRQDGRSTEVYQLEMCGHATWTGVTSMWASGSGSEVWAGTARLCAATVCTAPHCIIARTQVAQQQTLAMWIIPEQLSRVQTNTWELKPNDMILQTSPQYICNYKTSQVISLYFILLFSDVLSNST